MPFALLLFLLLAQVGARESVSSDDISVADGLQLPTYGHVWALDTWKGLPELVRLKPPETSHHETEFKGEAATVRVHDGSALFYVRGVSGADNGRSDLLTVRLSTEGQRRLVSKEAAALLKPRAKDQTSPDVIRLKQVRIGSTDWYRLTPVEKLTPGEYALIPLPNSSGFAEGEVFDFAVDPDAPENQNPLRSEQYREPR